MPSFELNRLHAITGTNALTDATRAGEKSAPQHRPAGAQGNAATAGVAVEIAAPIETDAPVDHDRVAEIRAALREGSYPLVPAEIADAMIAAQLSLKVAR